MNDLLVFVVSIERLDTSLLVGGFITRLRH